MEHSKEQVVQETSYEFPYHYVPRLRPHFQHYYSWSWGLYYLATMEFVLDRIRSLAPSSIVDLGTGDGRLVREMRRCVPGARLLGIDYSARAISLAKAFNPELDFRCADINRERIEDAFDVLTLIEVFEHIPLDGAAEFASSIRRLARPGSHLLVTVPHVNVPVSAKHFQHFSSGSLLRYFEPQWETIELRYLDKRGLASRLITLALENPLFILNEPRTRNMLYRLYKSSCLFTDERGCRRIYAHLIARA